jgi:hypothetical protein
MQAAFAITESAGRAGITMHQLRGLSFLIEKNYPTRGTYR